MKFVLSTVSVLLMLGSAAFAEFFDAFFAKERAR
jgi:hypothetical protein